MNSQTPGPITVKGTSRGLFAAPTIRNPDGLIAATRFLGSGIDAQEEHWVNAELLAASYTAFDKAGRELEVDAVELARSLDIAEALNLLGDCIPYLCDAMDSRANETKHSKKARALSARINAIAFPKIDAAFRAHKARQAAK